MAPTIKVYKNQYIYNIQFDHKKVNKTAVYISHIISIHYFFLTFCGRTRASNYVIKYAHAVKPISCLRRRFTSGV